ncbi:DUF5698 domain-containing protein [Clostridium sp.]|uniref:DUF5698 domain-containing protein n=1 Tax=Clostridium sp. TaxID=1506 RepID=UPI001A372F43|nr:DUF5698 domain-containing protein [Clostridium sp.]MBK5242897.1 hypothetical protein [Clostridium sp.]
MTSEIGICIIIFLCKIIEVSFATVRMVLITKGEKVRGAFVAFFEITIWLLVSAKVLTGLSEFPLRGVMYVLGFVVGNYLGSVIEEKVALGIVTATIITSTENKDIIVARLKELEIGFTVMQSQGQKDENKFIVAYMARKRKKVLLKNLNELNLKYFISINESRDVYGGYGLTRKIK